MFQKRIRKWELALCLAFICTCLAGLAGFASDCAQVREDVLRLHVIAHSDSEEDQALKLRVRDAVLEAGSLLFDGSTTVQSAKEKLEREVEALTFAAETEISRSGKTYPVTVKFINEYFMTRVYEQEDGQNVTLPAGEYSAIQVIIGDGAGQNWWCVMFPPLCLPAAQPRGNTDAYFGEEARIVEQSPQYEPRFKVVEWYEQLREKYR